MSRYSGTTDNGDNEGVTRYYANDAYVPEAWDHQVVFPCYCPMPTGSFLTNSWVWPGYDLPSSVPTYEHDNVWMYNQGTFTWNCDSNYLPPTVASRLAFAGSIPDSITLPKMDSFTSAYGLPIMRMYSGANGSPYLYTTVTASSVDPTGGSATFPLPSSLPQNAYAFVTENQKEDGSYMPNGFNFYSVASSQTIEGNPFGVAAQAISTSWQSAYNPDPYGDKTCAGQWEHDFGTYSYNVPVITQYSLNSVNNGGAAIPVGPNPTAIALFGYQHIYDNENNDPCNTYNSDTTQMTRAIVTNSGGNTVSILDLANNAVLSTVSVGNQPVAVAVSSDGSTAYVANYTDSTVTQVNLNSRTATATVAVGGQPTSVALTNAGTLWVGGAGFLSQMNAQSMSVVATVPVSNKTIVSLGYSNSVNQLVATSVDTGGNVYAEEINPSTVQVGSVYTPLASNMVSSVGTYSGQGGNTPVRAYTATVASAKRGRSGNLISTNQVGAPPLVVQDGWAVVTATPTGFTITDITGNVVLVSETTPSPVTAIAVDPNLNVVYLVMPDINTLLTVPLPGTGSN